MIEYVVRKCSPGTKRPGVSYCCVPAGLQVSLAHGSDGRLDGDDIRDQILVDMCLISIEMFGAGEAKHTDDLGAASIAVTACRAPTIRDSYVANNEIERIVFLRIGWIDQHRELVPGGCCSGVRTMLSRAFSSSRWSPKSSTPTASARAFLLKEEFPTPLLSASAGPARLDPDGDGGRALEPARRGVALAGEGARPRSLSSATRCSRRETTQCEASTTTSAAPLSDTRLAR